MLHRSITRSVLTAAVIAATAFSVTACSKPDTTAAGSSQQAAGTIMDADTAALVSSPSAAGHDTGKKKGAARDQLARALHATWVTKNKKGVVTHEAIRGEVTAVTATSVTVKAADGFSQTYTVGAGTTVLVRNLSATDQAGRRATASSMSAVKAGVRALVVGEGASTPSANRVVFLTGKRPVKAPTTPKPATTTNPAPSSTS